jgi:hypothetical protein
MSAETLLAQIVTQGFGGLLANLTTEYAKGISRKIKESKEDIKRDLKDHLENTFNKCVKVKTILNSDEPAETLSIYVDQSFKVKKTTIDQYSMVEKIRSDCSVVIIGEGGGGKSMFMRYLWLSYFEKSDGKIPFFLELRSMNSLSHNNISDFIYHSIIKSGSSIRQSEFSSAMKEGEFVLFLDGFDEINFDRRDAIQDMIIELKDQNPKLTIVLTSRDDERFMGWTSFEQATVLPLPKEKSNELIQKANCSTDTKTKFLKRFDFLWDGHSDFLSNPLLAYMMVVTFSYNPDIPKKMFHFYEQAFEALYHRHDLTKGYKRKFHTQLDKFKFIRLISFLCLKTYYDEELEFSRDALAHEIESVKGIEGINVEAEAFINDLVQSVCIMKPEGLTYTFTHRTFQEYFAAYCISRVAARDIDTLFANFAKRHSDKVLPMVADINPDLFREKYIIPNYKKFASFFDRKSDRGLYLSFARRVGATFIIRRMPHSSKLAKESKPVFFNFGLRYSGKMSDFFHVVRAVNAQDSKLAITKERSDDQSFARKAESILGYPFRNLQVKFEDIGPVFYFSDGLKENEITEEHQALLREEFLDTRMCDFLNINAKSMLEFVRSEVKCYNNITKSFNDLF